MRELHGPVVNAIEASPTHTNAYAGFGKLVQEVIGAAYTAFHDGLHAALYLSAGLALAAGLLAFITLRSTPVDTGSSFFRPGERFRYWTATAHGHPCPARERTEADHMVCYARPASWLVAILVVAWLVFAEPVSRFFDTAALVVAVTAATAGAAVAAALVVATFMSTRRRRAAPAAA